MELASKLAKYVILAETPASATTITTTTIITGTLTSQIHFLEKERRQDEAHHLENSPPTQGQR